MTKAGRLILALLLIANTQTALGSLTVRPQDVQQVLVGHSTRLTCATNNDKGTVFWKHYAVGQDPSSPDSVSAFVYAFGEVSGRYLPRFQVERNESTGATDLLIGQVNASDAGIYLCQESSGARETGRAQLIVIEPKPLCKFNSEKGGCGMERQELELHCSASFSGNSRPSLEWRKSGMPTAIKEGIRMENTPPSSISLILTVKAALSISNSSFVCQTTTIPASASKAQSSRVASTTLSATAPATVAKYNCASDGLQITCQSVIGTNGDECIFKSSSCGSTVNINESTSASNHLAAVTATAVPPSFPLLPVLIALLITVVIGALAVAIIVFWMRHQTQIRTMFARAEQLAFRRAPESITYRAEPIPIQTIRLVHADERQQRRIRGVATVGHEVFVVSSHCPEVVVYDSTAADFAEKRRFDLPGLVDAWDVVSSPTDNCLYVMDGKEPGTDKEIIRVEPTGDVKVFWNTKRKAGYLSVAGDGNIILAVYEKNVIVEYRPDGVQVRKIRIGTSNSSGAIIHPHHACKLDTGHFVVIHGIGESLHRACIINESTGAIVRSFGAKKGGPDGAHMNLPKYLAVDGAGSVMVLDQNNSRVVLLGYDLQFQRELLTARNGLVNPCKIHLNEANGRLYVAHHDTIQVFDIQQKNPVMPIL